MYGNILLQYKDIKKDMTFVLFFLARMSYTHPQTSWSLMAKPSCYLLVYNVPCDKIKDVVWQGSLIFIPTTMSFPNCNNHSGCIKSYILRILIPSLFIVNFLTWIVLRLYNTYIFYKHIIWKNLSKNISIVYK
jgi:hypothetical protein